VYTLIFLSDVTLVNYCRMRTVAERPSQEAGGVNDQ
jgi:hypothetical protein